MTMPSIVHQFPNPTLKLLKPTDTYGKSLLTFLRRKELSVFTVIATALISSPRLSSLNNSFFEQMWVPWFGLQSRISLSLATKRLLTPRTAIQLQSHGNMRPPSSRVKANKSTINWWIERLGSKSVSIVISRESLKAKTNIIAMTNKFRVNETTNKYKEKLELRSCCWRYINSV